MAAKLPKLTNRAAVKKYATQVITAARREDSSIKLKSITPAFLDYCDVAVARVIERAVLTQLMQKKLDEPELSGQAIRKEEQYGLEEVQRPQADSSRASGRRAKSTPRKRSKKATSNKRAKK